MRDGGGGVILSQRRGRNLKGHAQRMDDSHGKGVSWGWGLGAWGDVVSSALVPSWGEEPLGPLTTHLCWSSVPPSS